MPQSHVDIYRAVFPNCRRTLGLKTWGRVLAELDRTPKPAAFPDALHALQPADDLPDFIGDLARIEWTRHLVMEERIPPLGQFDKVTVNPALNLVPVSWQNLMPLIDGNAETDPRLPSPAQTHILVWRHPKSGELVTREADDTDLLALKIIIEQIDPRQAAATGQGAVATIQAAIDRAIAQGILLSPGSLIRRGSSAARQASAALEPFLNTDIFTLQWHITQACDLHCRHCYDRSDRTPMPYSMATSILDDFYEFCDRMHVRGQVSFTGGNPLLYPRFADLYQAAWERGFGIAILGNPGPVEQIERLLPITKPRFFQVSLEGLAEHNDTIRGDGHFQRTLEFLRHLRGMGIYTMVMLTLTRDNLDQVIPLGRLLEGQVDFFTFNRLAAVGEGKHLRMPPKNDFETFLRNYEKAARDLSVLGLKDNLINIVRVEKGRALFGGCTGYGCGAAFNFVAVLPDGEVHACRKFPSPVGNIRTDRLIDIYRSDLAKKYRSGSDTCRVCSLSTVCRGCLAVTYSCGLDVFTDKDPFCFVSEEISVGH